MSSAFCNIFVTFRFFLFQKKKRFPASPMNDGKARKGRKKISKKFVQRKSPTVPYKRSSKNLETRWGNARKHYKSTGCIKHEACAPLSETRPLRKSVGFTLKPRIRTKQGVLFSFWYYYTTYLCKIQVEIYENSVSEVCGFVTGLCISFTGELQFVFSRNFALQSAFIIV